MNRIRWVIFLCIVVGICYLIWDYYTANWDDRTHFPNTMEGFYRSKSYGSNIDSDKQPYQHK